MKSTLKMMLDEASVSQILETLEELVNERRFAHSSAEFGICEKCSREKRALVQALKIIDPSHA